MCTFLLHSYKLQLGQMERREPCVEQPWPVNLDQNPWCHCNTAAGFIFFCRQTWLILQSRPLDGFIKPAKSRFRDPAGKRKVLHSQFWGRTDSWSVSCDQCRLKLPEWTAKQPQSKCSFVLAENQTVIWSHSPFKPSLLLQLRACDSEKLVRITHSHTRMLTKINL